MVISNLLKIWISLHPPKNQSGPQQWLNAEVAGELWWYFICSGMGATKLNSMSGDYLLVGRTSVQIWKSCALKFCPPPRQPHTTKVDIWKTIPLIPGSSGKANYTRSIHVTIPAIPHSSIQLKECTQPLKFEPSQLYQVVQVSFESRLNPWSSNTPNYTTQFRADSTHGVRAIPAIPHSSSQFRKPTQPLEFEQYQLYHTVQVSSKAHSTHGVPARPAIPSSSSQFRELTQPMEFEHYQLYHTVQVSSESPLNPCSSSYTSYTTHFKSVQKAHSTHGVREIPPIPHSSCQSRKPTQPMEFELYQLYHTVQVSSESWLNPWSSSDISYTTQFKSVQESHSTHGVWALPAIPHSPSQFRKPTQPMEFERYKLYHTVQVSSKTHTTHGIPYMQSLSGR